MITEPPIDNARGIAFILLSCITIATSVMLIRAIGKDLSSFEVIFFRCSFSLFYILLLNARSGRQFFHSQSPLLLSIRSLILPIVVLGNFYAILHLPLMQFTAIQFTKPLFLVILAALFLGEKIRLPRTTATFCGFIGVLIILRPEGTVSFAQTAVLGAALGTAVIAVLTKKLTKDHSASTMVFYGNLVLLLVCLGPTIAYWKMPDLYQMMMIAGLGLTTYAGQVFMVQAYRHGETTVVVPFEYFRIVFLAAAGYIIFNEIPDRWTILGTLIICFSTFFIALHEARKAHKAQKKRS